MGHLRYTINKKAKDYFLTILIIHLPISEGKKNHARLIKQEKCRQRQDNDIHSEYYLSAIDSIMNYLIFSLKHSEYPLSRTTEKN